MDYCNRAVNLNPVAAGYRDSRGVARALTGEIAGAIDDFNFYVEHGYKVRSLDKILKRRHWIRELETGRNPFDSDTLEDLRKK